MENLNNSFRFELLIVFFVITISCNEKVKTGNLDSNSFYTIPFADIVKNKRKVNLSEIARDVKLIQFDNIREAMLGNIEDIEFTNDYIFIKFWMHPVLQFARDGKFIRNIGTKGKGPGEYNSCIKMSVDEKNKRIYIQTIDLSIMVFNFDGGYVKTVKFSALEKFQNFWIWGRDSMLVSYFEPVFGNEPFIFIEYNEQGDTLQTIPNYIFYDKQASPFHVSPFEEQNFYYRFENKLHLKGFYNDTVYTYSESNRFIPKFYIDLKEHKLPDDLIYERDWTRPLPNDLYWTGVHETSNYIFIPYGYHFDQNKPEYRKEEKGCILFNKKTEEGIALEETKQGGLIDDIIGGPNFRPMAIKDNTAIMLVSALDMKQYLNSDKFKNQEVKFPAEKEKLNQLNKTLNENDNHFLILVKL